MIDPRESATDRGEVIGYVVGDTEEAVTLCVDCEPEWDGEIDRATIRDGDHWGEQVPYPECYLCEEVIRPESPGDGDLMTDGGADPTESERGGLLSGLKCLFTGHKHRRMRAVDRESDTWQRLEDGEVVENIDGCTILEECVRCGDEKRMSASVETAKRMGIPLEWNRSAQTGSDQ